MATQEYAAARRVKVFISWSGDLSKKLAGELRSWLPCVLQAVDPYMSDQDLSQGTRWSTEIAGILDQSDCGIVCVTPDNMDSSWLNFETGALAKSIRQQTRVCPVLLGLSKAELRYPLAMFQAADCSKDDMLKVVKSINEVTGSAAVAENVIGRTFDGVWPQIEAVIASLQREAAGLKTQSAKGKPPAAHLPQADLLQRLDDIVLMLRDQERLLSSSATLSFADLQSERIRKPRLIRPQLADGRTLSDARDQDLHAWLRERHHNLELAILEYNASDHSKGKVLLNRRIRQYYRDYLALCDLLGGVADPETLKAADAIVGQPPLEAKQSKDSE